jgi:hypothetical protein
VGEYYERKLFLINLGAFGIFRIEINILKKSIGVFVHIDNFSVHLTFLFPVLIEIVLNIFGGKKHSLVRVREKKGAGTR